MQIVSILLQKLVHQELVLLRTHNVKVPHGMVEDHQHVGLLVQRNQDLCQPRVAGLRRKIRQRLHPLRRPRAGQVVNPQMKRLHPVRRAPLHGYRNLPRARHRPQQHRRFDVVVIGERDHRRQVQLPNLAALQVKRQLRRHRRGPVSRRIVDWRAVVGLRAPLHPRKQRPHQRILIPEVRQEVQRLLGLVGVTVQRNTRPEAACRILVAPQVRDGRLGHF